MTTMTLKEKWELLKADLDHENSFLDIHSALTGGSAGEEPEAQLAAPGAPVPPPQEAEEVPEQAAPAEASVTPEQEAPPEETEQSPEGEAEPEAPAGPQLGAPGTDAPPEAEQEQGAGGEEEQPEGDGDEEQTEAELVEALKQLGHTDSEIAHIVHGHSLTHAVEHLKEKIQEDFEALKEHQNLDHSGKMSEIELAHKQRMLDAEHASVDPAHEGKVRDMELDHKKRMLDLEHTHATRMKDLEFETKKSKASETNK